MVSDLPAFNELEKKILRTLDAAGEVDSPGQLAKMVNERPAAIIQTLTELKRRRLVIWRMELYIKITSAGIAALEAHD